MFSISIACHFISKYLHNEINGAFRKFHQPVGNTKERWEKNLPIPLGNVCEIESVHLAQNKLMAKNELTLRLKELCNTNPYFKTLILYKLVDLV